jgi:hypothetical protein
MRQTFLTFTQEKWFRVTNFQYVLYPASNIRSPYATSPLAIIIDVRATDAVIELYDL